MKGQEFMILSDGRKLVYSEYGIETGHPVFFFHGTPSSRLEALMVGDQIFIEHNLRIIAPNRPGMGPSDFQQNRVYSSWPQDVLELAAHLGLEKFSVLGNSGGGGYVAACAAKIPDRLISAVVTAGAWQMNEAIKYSRLPFRAFWTITDKKPALLSPMISVMRAALKLPKKKALEQLKQWMSSADLEALLQGERLALLSKALDEGTVNKAGARLDIELLVKKWDFDLLEVKFPITFFHGQRDENVPVKLVEQRVETLRDALLISFKDEAHFSVLCNQFNKIAQALLNKNV